MTENQILIFHHLTYGNALYPVSSYGQSQFFIWGPIGGTETIPVEYSKHFKFPARIIEFVRRLVVYTLKINTLYIKQCENANLILCKTDTLLKTVPEKFKSKAVLFTDVAADISLRKYSNNREQKTFVDFVSVGRFQSWRGFDILIEAFAKAVREQGGLHLTLIGAGKDAPRLKSLVSKLRISQHVTFTGRIATKEYRERMRMADVVINPSLKEGAVTVSFDAMSLGTPLICLDTGAIHVIFQMSTPELYQSRRDQKQY